MICIVATGSRGDVAPVVPLAAALVRRGHPVRLVANDDTLEMAARQGVPVAGLGFRVSDLMRSPAGQAMMEAGSAFRSRERLVAAACQLIARYGRRIIELTEDADIILSTETVFLPCQVVAERRDIPQVALCFKPYGRTAAYRSFYADVEPYRSMPNRESHDAVQQAYLAGLLESVNPLRQACGIAPLTAEAANEQREACPSLMAYSAAVCPPPDDWPAHRRVTGYWRSAASDYGVSDAVRSFVEAGAPPVYIGFGSMVRDVDRILDVIAPLANRYRFLVAGGWSEVPERTLPNVLVVDGVDHAWAFPRMAAVVHHGGAGTTAASLSAGVPSLIAWSMVDQVFWAQTVEALGAGANLGPSFWFDTPRVLDGLERCPPRERLAALASRIQAEDGVGTAVQEVERLLA